MTQIARTLEMGRRARSALNAQALIMGKSKETRGMANFVCCDDGNDGGNCVERKARFNGENCMDCADDAFDAY